MTAIALAGTPTTDSNTNQGSITGTAPAGLSEGDVMVADVAVSAPGSSVDNPIATPGGWTLQTGDVDLSSPGVRLNTYTRAFQDGDTSWVWSWDNNANGRIVITPYSGVDPVDPVPTAERAANVIGASSATRTTPAITTDGDRWVHHAHSDRSGSSYTSTSEERADLSGTSTSLGVYDSSGDVAAGTFSRTATASNSTSVGVNTIVALQGLGGVTGTVAATQTDTAEVAGTSRPPVQVVRPIADTNAGAWTTETGGATNLFASVDEEEATFDDYIRSEDEPDASPVVLRLAPLAEPTGTPDDGDIQVHLTYDKAGLQTMELVMELRQGYTNEGSPGTLIASETDPDVTDSAVSALISLTAVEAAEIVYTGGQAADLDVRMVADTIIV